MTDYQDYQIWAAYLNEAIGSSRDLLHRPADWNPGLQELWYHPDAKELATAGTSERIQHGYLQRLTAHSPALRGPEPNRRSLYPVEFLGSLGTKVYENLSLHNVRATNCHISFDLGRLELKVSFLSPNTAVQLYWPDAWLAIADTARYKYGIMPEQRMLTFSVALALDFGEFVISINGPDDMLFTVDWIPHVKSEAMDMSRSSVTNMLEAWPSYMQNVVKWLEHVYPAMTPEQKDMDISSFMSQNSDEQHLFAGIKQHSRSEVLYRAGLSPELTLREVVEARSRLYRLILGAWQYKYLVLHHTWPTFIKPTVYHRAIAPLFHQRLKYTDSSLHAHGKSPITLSTRLAEQLQKINDESEELASDGRRLSFDAFEPSLLEDALKHAPEFCPAIFGQSFWNSHKGEIDKLPWDGNPLVEKDTREGSFLSSVNLICTESWTRLLLPQKYRRSRAVKAYVYAQGTPNEIWTPIKPWRTPNTEVITSPQSHGDISSTQDIYMPGVLESPGVAVAVRSKSGKSRFTYPSRGVATDDSPATYQMMHVNLVKTLARITENKNHIARRGTIAMSEEEKAQRARAYKAFDEMWLDRFGYVPTSTKSSTGTEGTTKQESGLKRPRKRRQVDLVLADVQEEDKPQARKRARVENGISMRVDKEKEWWEEPYYG